MTIDENYTKQLCDTVAKTIVNAFENLTIEDVNMYQLGYNKALDDIKTKIDDEYCDGGYGDYHEVEMIVRMIEQLSKE